jgi:succinate dehydrogenase/fumarate reductase iron-sulfur protein
MIVKVFRYGKEMTEQRYDSYALDPEPGMSVLGALFEIQEKYDDSLAFRYSCRGAVCGTCAMLINKVPRLACRTQISSLLDGSATLYLAPYPAIEGGAPYDPSTEVLVEPLPHLPVIRDLVVDMTRFFAAYRAIQPIFKPRDPPPERERTMEPSAVHDLEKYTSCILCAACYGACPVNAREPEYLGPAALAKLYRFHVDPREAGDDSRLEIANTRSGWWGCEFHINCTRVCPKGVPPSVAIGSAHEELKRSGRAPRAME